MSSSILEKDSDIRFPHFMILKASAGSGKTYALTERFVQFILSEKIHRNSLKNILAVTFSNNAAKEMKERILQRLKAICFDDLKSMDEMCSVLSPDRERIKNKAAQLIEEILNNYSDFQVKTIDSFMTTVFKASAIDFGYNPEFEILMSIDPLMKYSFDRFLRDVREGTVNAKPFRDVQSLLEPFRDVRAF
jgi:ATP-dependent exoDNAse (exonuclease V) beta subunit